MSLSSIDTDPTNVVFGDTRTSIGPVDTDVDFGGTTLMEPTLKGDWVEDTLRDPIRLDPTEPPEVWANLPFKFWPTVINDS